MSLQKIRNVMSIRKNSAFSVFFGLTRSELIRKTLPVETMTHISYKYSKYCYLNLAQFEFYVFNVKIMNPGNPIHQEFKYYCRSDLR